jgi:signal transduction histidine kinase
VARRNGRSHATDGAEPLERIADLSRGLVDSMSDIVWAINPQRDHLSDLEHRMRRFAADVLAPRDIDLELEVPVRMEDIPLRAEVRRQVFLIFKECIHNIVRHSGCRRVQVALEYQGHRLLLRLSDDGTGFAATGVENGHGLASMRQRAMEIGGKLEIASQAGGGTRITLEVPLLSRPARV